MIPISSKISVKHKVLQQFHRTPFLKVSRSLKNSELKGLYYPHMNYLRWEVGGDSKWLPRTHLIPFYTLSKGLQWYLEDCWPKWFITQITCLYTRVIAKHTESFSETKCCFILTHFISHKLMLPQRFDIFPEISLNQEMEVDYFSHKNSEMIFECKRILKLP